MKELTQEKLKSLFVYHPDTGVFVRKCRMGRGGARGAKKPNSNGYIMIMIEGQRYYAHRLAFLYMLGRWPIGETDHIDLDRTNNSWSNLREVSRSENQLNKSVTRASASGIKGVCWDSRNGRWLGYVCGKQKSFKDLEECKEWVVAERMKQGEFARHE